MINFLWWQETAEQGGTGKPTLNHLHCQAHGNAEVGPDGEDVSRTTLTQARDAASRSRGAGHVGDPGLGGLVRQETEGALHFCAGVADIQPGISPASRPLSFLK